MNTYEKPLVEINCECAEGVYAASGSGACDSIYMLGIFKKGNPGGTTYKEKHGCAGCNAYTGNGCKFSLGKKVNDNSVCKPSWEKQGHLPDEKCNNGNGKKN